MEEGNVTQIRRNKYDVGQKTVRREGEIVKGL
jgi:hypothetical protein